MNPIDNDGYCTECGAEVEHYGHHVDCTDYDAEEALMEAAYALKEERDLA
jgi:hypothetical protein